MCVGGAYLPAANHNGNLAGKVSEGYKKLGEKRKECVKRKDALRVAGGVVFSRPTFPNPGGAMWWRGFPTRHNRHQTKKIRMIDIPSILSAELGLQAWQVQNALQLLDEGGTLPFIARYRKERTGEMNEIQLRDLFDRFAYLTELQERKEAILASIAEQGKLTDELRKTIEACLVKTDLEDLYLPFKPKRRTRATIAREKGLEPLAQRIRDLNTAVAPHVRLDQEATPFISVEHGVMTAQEALKGAADILAEEVAERAGHRAWIREFFLREGAFVTKVKDTFPEGTTKFEMYRQFRVPVSRIAAHTMLAMRRGEEEEVLTLELQFDEEGILAYLGAQEIRTRQLELREFLEAMLRDAFQRLMRASLIGEVRYQQKQVADAESIRTFEENLRNLLLASPAGMKPTLGVDPGFRTGCKIAVIDGTGQLIEYRTIFPHQSQREREAAGATVRALIAQHGIQLVAVGNGTAGRETEAFLRETLDASLPAGPAVMPAVVMVSESGASVYSASEVAIEEFAELDLTVRGAISIGRRLQDPLAELVKIDPKSIGVGQYQHDVDQRLLKKKLEETVEGCVNHVGVDLNLASKELLGYVAGITPSVARSIVDHRNRLGAFRNRRELLNVLRFGAKAFEQAAGFLRIRGGDEPLDNTAVHPERYAVVERMAADLNIPLPEITRVPERLKALDLQKYITDDVGQPTLRDILAELEKPGRDPRAEFRYANFSEGVKAIADLNVGMELEGVVTNVANFGAFVDIGVHQDGLVHISQLSDRFVNDPKTVVHVGQVVKVRVLEVNEQLRRISLTMRSGQAPARSNAPRARESQPAQRPFTVDDLKAKFGKG